MVNNCPASAALHSANESPGNPFFGSVLGKHEYTPRPHTQAAVTKCTIKAEFAPDPVAYELVKGIYSYFEFGENSIPGFFDVDHNFTLRQGTIC